MLTLFHAPLSRSTALAVLLEELGVGDRVALREVTIPRMDGSGARDPANPHPEGKVPVLLHDGRVITERGAIIAHLCGLFPEAGLAPEVGSADWGVFLAWLGWYQGVLEPVLILDSAGVEHPWIRASLRGVDEATARIRAALEQGPWLMGEKFSAADLLVHSPYAWFAEFMPDDPLIRDWVARCMARPASVLVRDRDTARMAA